MQHHLSTEPVLNILIPWHSVIPIDPVLTLARTVGGPHANLMLLPVGPGGARHDVMLAVWSESEAERASARFQVEMLDAPDSADPAMEIGLVAAERNANLILMATLCHPIGEIDATCRAAQLALDSPIPVMLVHVDGDGFAFLPSPILRLLVPLDGSPRAVQALPFTANLARRLSLTVQLVMVIDPERVLPPAYAYDAEASAEMVARLTSEAHGALTEAEQQLAREGIAVNSTLVYGPVIECLEGEVQPGDVLVMTTHGIGGAVRSQLGSVAARLVADLPGPLVIMRGNPPAAVVVSGRREHVPFESWSTV